MTGPTWNVIFGGPIVCNDSRSLVWRIPIGPTRDFSSPLLLCVACCCWHLFKRASEQFLVPDTFPPSACSKQERLSNLTFLSLRVLYFRLWQVLRVTSSGVWFSSDKCGMAGRGVCVQVVSVDSWCLRCICCHRWFCEVSLCHRLMLVLFVRLLTFLLFFLSIVTRFAGKWCRWRISVVHILERLSGY